MFWMTAKILINYCYYYLEVHFFVPTVKRFGSQSVLAQNRNSNPGQSPNSICALNRFTVMDRVGGIELISHTPSIIIIKQIYVYIYFLNIVGFVFLATRRNQ